jgi:hypothetical protein
MKLVAGSGYHSHRGGKAQHFSGRRNRRRAPYSEIMIQCPDGLAISKRELRTLCEEAYSPPFGRHVAGLWDRIIKFIPKPQIATLLNWMRATNARKYLGDDRMDELCAALFIKAARRLKEELTWLYNQIRTTGTVEGILIRAAST